MITLKDKIAYAVAHGEPLPLKGHTKLILEDVRDGSQKVVESDNMITNAISSILANNWEGSADFSSLQPLRSLFGGVLLFQDEIEEDEDNYMPPNDLVNPLVAHAGDIANNTGSSLRGSPVTSDIEITDTSIKNVWLWDNSSGNGTIQTVCLCPDTLGNMGLKPYDEDASAISFNPLSNMTPTWSKGSDLFRPVTKEAYYQYPISVDEDGKTGKALWISGTTFTETTVRHDWLSFGIMRDRKVWQKVSERTATIRTFDLNKSSVFETDTHYWIYQITSATSLKIDKVAKSNMAVTQADITYSGVSFFTGNIGDSAHPMNIAFPRNPYDGTYLYLPNSSNNGFVAVNPSDNSDVFALDRTVQLATGVMPYTRSEANQFMRPITINSGLILGGNYIINGASVYQIKELNGLLVDNANYAGQCIVDTIKRGASLYGSVHQWYWDANRTGDGSALMKMFLSSINVLPEAKVKTTSQTMRVIYTLTEAT